MWHLSWTDDQSKFANLSTILLYRSELPVGIPIPGRDDLVDSCFSWRKSNIFGGKTKFPVGLRRIPCRNYWKDLRWHIGPVSLGRGRFPAAAIFIMCPEFRRPLGTDQLWPLFALVCATSCGISSPWSVCVCVFEIASLLCRRDDICVFHK